METILFRFKAIITILAFSLRVRFCIVNLVRSVSSGFSSKKLIGILGLSNIKNLTNNYI